MPKTQLTDMEVHEALMKASSELPNPDDCEGDAAKTAVEASMKALLGIQMALLMIIDQNEP